MVLGEKSYFAIPVTPKFFGVSLLGFGGLFSRENVLMFGRVFKINVGRPQWLTNGLYKDPNRNTKLAGGGKI